MHVLREYGQNDSIGELDVITAVDRSETVHAIRDSELVRIPAALFDAISIKHPETTVQFMRLIAGRVRRALGDEMNGRVPGLPTTDMNLSEFYWSDKVTYPRTDNYKKRCAYLALREMFQWRSSLVNSKMRWRRSGHLRRT